MGLFTFQTKIDFTKKSGCLLVATVVILSFGIGAIFYHNKILKLVYACLGALLFGMYIVCDAQMMIGGDYRLDLDPEEYIFAALNIYIDIVYLFWRILEIISDIND